MKKIFILILFISLSITCLAKDIIKMWDSNNGKLINQININQNDWIEVLILDKEKMLVTNGEKLYLYEIKGLEKLKQIIFKELEEGFVGEIIPTNDNRIIYFFEDGIYEGDINSLKVRRIYKFIDGEANPYLLKYNERERKLAVTGEDGIIRIFDIKTKKKVKSIENPDASITDMCFSSDSKYLITSDRSGYVYMRDANTFKIVKKFFHNSNRSNALSVAISPDGKYIASGGTIDKIIKLWDVKTGKLVKELKGHTSVIYSLQFSPDSTKLLSSSGKCDELNLTDDKIKLWDISTGKVIMEIKGNKESAYRAIFTPDGNNIITWCGGQKSIEDFGD